MQSSDGQWGPRMGSVVRVTKGSVRVLCNGGAGPRIDIRLPVTLAAGRAISNHIDHLVRCKQSG